MAHSPVYVKALPLQELDDVESVKEEVKAGNILIVRVVPLARKSVEETKLAITELTDYVKGLGGDIARLGEERIWFRSEWPENPSIDSTRMFTLTSSTFPSWPYNGTSFKPFLILLPSVPSTW